MVGNNIMVYEPKFDKNGSKKVEDAVSRNPEVQLRHVFTNDSIARLKRVQLTRNNRGFSSAASALNPTSASSSRTAKPFNRINSAAGASKLAYEITKKLDIRP